VFIDHEQFKKRYEKALDLLLEYFIVEYKNNSDGFFYIGQQRELEEVYFAHLKYHLREVDEILLQDKFHFKVFKFLRDDVKYLEIILMLIFCFFLDG